MFYRGKAMNYKLILSIFLFLSILTTTDLTAINPEINLEVYGINKAIAQKIEQNFRTVVKTANADYQNQTLLNGLINLCSANCYHTLKSFLTDNKLKFQNPKYELEVLIREHRGYQIRNVEVLLNASDSENFIFDFDLSGLICDVRCSLWNTYNGYDLEPIISNKDQKIIEKFLEEYRTAFYNKDEKKIAEMINPDAIMIIGRVKRTKSHQLEIPDPEDVELYVRDKPEYLSKLKEIFSNNKHIDLHFDLIEIRQHHQCPELFGISLLQRWHSIGTEYKDLGWLFLLFNSQDKEKPVIEFRCWHPRKESNEHFGLENLRIIHIDSGL